MLINISGLLNFFSAFFENFAEGFPFSSFVISISKKERSFPKPVPRAFAIASFIANLAA